MSFLQRPAQEAVWEQIRSQVESTECPPGKPGILDFQLVNGKLHSGQACLEDEVLTLDLDLNEDDLDYRGIGPHQCWQTLLKQRGDEYSAKFVPHWQSNGGGFRQEVRLIWQQDWTAQIAAAFAGLIESLEANEPEAESFEKGGFCEEQTATIKASLTETNWPSSIDDQGRISTQLITSREKSFRQLYRYTAWIIPRGKRGIQVWVPILDGVPLGPDQCEAIAAILMEAGRRLRLVRGSARQENGLASVSLEAFHHGPLSNGQLDGLLKTMTMACSEVGPEIEEFSKERVAARYEESFGIARQVDPAKAKEGLKAAQQGSEETKTLPSKHS